MYHSQNGFTLIELMMTIIILGILASFATMTYRTFLVRAQVSEAIVLMTETRYRVQEYWEVTGQLPTNNVEAGLAESGTINSQYVASTLINNGQITTKMKNSGVSSAVQGKSIILKPTIVNSRLLWNCEAGTINPRYTPSNCRS